ncbi:MAG: AMP-binding protein, partial [Flavobacteriaceae bacterium]
NSSTIESLDLKDSLEVFTLDLMDLSVALEDYQTLELTGEDLAYVIYTSGSTGLSKGTLIPHKGIVRLHDWSSSTLSDSHKFLQLSSISFDAATFEIWCPLLSGGELVLYPDGELDLTAVNSLIKKESIDTVWFTSALFDQWSNEDLKGLSLRYILSGGDVVSFKTVSTVYSQLPGVRIFNGYGPTENTTFTCCYEIPSSDFDTRRSIPIGKPINGTEVYVLNKELNLVPINAIGELYTSGLGLFKGYLNNEALTKEKLIDHPYKPGELLYGTGDLVRWLSDGTIEFVGRKDDQIKIRGYRIELGEIESCLSAQEGVSQSVVLVKEKGASKHLVAYVDGS